MPPPPFNQAFPPTPTFTEKDIGSLAGKIFIVTGSTSGVGLELAKILYSKAATVYIAARSSDKIKLAIKNIKADHSSSVGVLVPLTLDLADLASIKKSADEFLSKADRLDVLVHNAGVMTPPAGSKTKLGHDLEMGTNCLGPFLFNHYLEPVLKRTAANADRNSVRIVWLSSMLAVGTPPDGIIFDGKTGNPKVIKNAMENYMESKVGNLFLASEAAKRLGSDGIISVVCTPFTLCTIPTSIEATLIRLWATNPGLMKTELQRHSSPVQGFIMGILFKGPKYGAYTELFSALSPAISSKNNGAFVIPWGRLGEVPPHIAKGMKSTTEGGTGLAEKFWEWCERETKPFW